MKQMNLEFKQELKGNSISVSDVNCLFGTNGLDYDLEDLKAYIDYSVSLDVRSWGIDGVSLSVSKIVVSANINIYKEWLNTDEIELLKSKGFKEYQDDLTLFNWDLSVFNALKVEEDVLEISQISIDELSIDISLIKDSIVVKGTVK